MAVSHGKAPHVGKGGAGKTNKVKHGPKMKADVKEAKVSKKHAMKTKHPKGGRIPS